MQFWIFLVWLSATAAGAQPANVNDPDSLYANRIDMASARAAAQLWSAALRQNDKNFEAAWKLSRADYWLGGHAPERERRKFLENGVAAGKAAAAREPNRPEGYFWAAANMGELAESSSLRAGIRYRRPIKDALETVLRLAPAFLAGSADRALGRWYAEVPRLFGGSPTLAEQHLRRSLSYDPTSTASHLFLAELMIDQGRTAEARMELQRVLEAPYDPEWAPEDEEFMQKARALLNRK